MSRVPLHSIDGDSIREETDKRRKEIEDRTGVSLGSIGDYGFDGETAEKNIENMVGGIQVPLGVAGPLEVEGGFADGEYYVPIATTEGALVASVNRGCSSITESGGAVCQVFKDAMTRAPVFRVASPMHAKKVIEWVDDNFDVLKDEAESTTEYGELLSIDPYISGDSLFLRFSFDSKDAMGMNMATVATRTASETIEEKTDAALVALSGNMCADKKPAAINAIEGRGKTVVSEVNIQKETVKEKLKTTPERIEEINRRKTFIGSTRSVTLGANAHASNIVAGIYLATGQDIAQLVEGSVCITDIKTRKDGGINASVTLPSIEVGTVGGGTRLDTQKECLKMLGVEGSGDPPGSNSKELAEILAATVLAGELSLHAAFASRDLADAHEELGR